MAVKKVEYQDFGVHRQTPEEIIDRAEEIIAKATADAAKIEQIAYEQGFAQGEQAGIKMGMASAQPNVEGVAALIEQLNTMLLATLEAMEPEIIRLVQLVAERVIYTKIAADDEVLVKIIKAAMAEVDKKWEVTVRVNSQEHETLSLYVNEFERIRESKKVTLVADPGVEPGSCFVEAPPTFVHASVRQALENLFNFEE